MLDAPQTIQSSIHVHALWRTGSTQWWSLMRDAPSLRAYYEPFHENMLNRTHELCQESHDSKPKHDIFRHPQVKDHYFAEFPLSDSGGIGLFHSRFILDDFVKDVGERDPEMSAYIKALIHYASNEGQTAAFQYNRSAFRAAWLQEEFGGQHIYLVRNPAGILKSSMSFTAANVDKRGPGNYFLTCPVMVIGKASTHPIFSETARLYNISPYQGESFKDEISHYSEVAGRLSEQAHKDITALFWSLGLCNAVGYADLIVDVDALASGDYSKEIEVEFNSLTDNSINLGSYRKLSSSEKVIGVSPEMQKIISAQIRDLGIDLGKLDSAIKNEASRETVRQLILSE